MVDVKWLCTVPALVLIFHGVSRSISVFVSVFRCEFYVQLNLSHWINITVASLSQWLTQSSTRSTLSTSVQKGIKLTSLLTNLYQ